MSAESEVRAASEKFYSALNHMATGDAGPMAQAWSHGAAVTTMHPLGGRDTGWDKVGPTWSEVAKIASGGQVKLHDQHIHAAGDMAYEVGVERDMSQWEDARSTLITVSPMYIAEKPGRGKLSTTTRIFLRR